MWYMTMTDTSSVYHNLKHDRKSSYLTTFPCQFGRYRLIRLSFGVAPMEDMFQRKINEIFKGLPNVFCIADDILIVGYDHNGRDHDRTLKQVVQFCCQENLKFNSINAISGAPRFFWEMISREVQPDPKKPQTLR